MGYTRYDLKKKNKNIFMFIFLTCGILILAFISGSIISNLFIKDMTHHMRNLMMAKISQNPEEVLDMSEEGIEIMKAQADKLRIEEIMRYIRILQETIEQSKWSNQNRIYLELAVIKMCKIEYDTSKEVLV